MNNQLDKLRHNFFEILKSILENIECHIPIFARYLLWVRLDITAQALAKLRTQEVDGMIRYIAEIANPFCNGQEKSDTTIERLLLFCSKQLGDKYPSFECSRT